MARAPTHRLRPLESAILHSVLVRKASQDSVQDDGNFLDALRATHSVQALHFVEAENDRLGNSFLRIPFVHEAGEDTAEFVELGFVVDHLRTADAGDRVVFAQDIACSGQTSSHRPQ